MAKVVEDYFLSILRNIQEYDQFQVYGHLDYIVRYAPEKDRYYNPLQYHEVCEKILRHLIEHGKGIEINTSGYKSGLKFPNPHPDLLKLYRRLGGEIITFGSDAHFPEYVGYESKKACDLLKDCGFSYYTTFKNQIPEFHKL